MLHSLTGIVIMGSCGSGKTTLGRRLAAALGCRFVEGDDLHPATNVAKMTSGTALDDNDRWPWLGAVGLELARSYDSGCVISCSALKRSYRDLIRTTAGTPVLFVYPRVDPSVLHERLTRRLDHYMPPSLLDSQLAAFEMPDETEAVLVLDGTQPVDELVAAVTTHLVVATPSSALSSGSPETEHVLHPGMIP